jgi:predicted PurR-regulated permease PerM
MLGDYTPAVEFLCIVFIVAVIYVLICRPIINQIISVKDKHRRSLLIKDKRYSQDTFAEIKNQILKEQSDVLNNRLKSDFQKIMNIIKIIFISIKSFFSKFANIKNIPFKKKSLKE